MKFWEFFRFEFGYQIRRIPIWIFFVALLVFTLFLSVELLIPSARSGGYLYNGPFSILSATIFGSLAALLVPAFLAGNAATRDVEAHMDALVYTTPISKTAYLGGRFFAAFVLFALILLALPAGHMIVTILPGLESELIGPFRLDAYLGSWLIFSIPMAFVVTAFLFVMAVLSRRAIISYFGSLFLFLGSLFCWGFLAGQMGLWELAKLLDPIGMTITAEFSRAWAPAEKSMRMFAFEGSLLYNRISWIGFALVALAGTFFHFRFAHHTPVKRWWHHLIQPRVVSASDDMGNIESAIDVPTVGQKFHFGVRIRQMFIISLVSFRSIIMSWGGFIIGVLALIMILSGPGWMQQMGIPLFPTTERIVGFIGNSQDLLWVVVPLLIIYYAGELVWQERDEGLNEITDAAPVPEWVSLLGKYLGLALMLIALQASMMAASIFIQTMMDYHQFEIGLYLQVLFGIQFADYLLFTTLVFAVHVLVNHKYISHLISIFVFTYMAFGADLGIHNLLIYGSDPGWNYSDMRGFGHYLTPLLWFKIYWVAWALLIGMIAKLFWVRGKEQGYWQRLQLAQRRFTIPVIWTALAAAGLLLTSGGYIFYNTNILNEYRTDDELLEQQAQYERLYGHFEEIAQPLLTDIRLLVEIWPKQGTVEIQGTYSLFNNRDMPIDSIHLSTNRNVKTRSIQFGRLAKTLIVDTKLGHHTYVLEQPLQPGDSLKLNFEVYYNPKGFRNAVVQTSVVANGTFFEPENWMPAIGYRRSREISNPGIRRSLGLHPRPVIPLLDDEDARYDFAGDERITFEAVVGTDSDQTALAPGRLHRMWTKEDRRYFHYKTDVPIRNDYAIFSADYAVHKANWNDVAIEIFHHPGHAANMEIMTQSTQASLKYLSEHFEPYPHGQLRLIEYPAPGISLHGYPVNISYTEGFSLFNTAGDSLNAIFPFAVVAHEIAHQWWGNLLSPAFVEGSVLLTESLAWYSALGVVEEAYDPRHLRQLLALMKEDFLTPQSRAGQPLLRTSSTFDAYRRGPFTMYALREYIGKERINSVLINLVKKFELGKLPLSTSLDLYRELQAVTPDSLQYLLSDLLEENTWWELKTEQVQVDSKGVDEWHITLDVSARKLNYDVDGAVTEEPMNDWVEIGIFAPAEDVKWPGKPLYLQRHRINSEQQTIKVTVPSKPASVGIDPYHLLIEENPDDNILTLGN